MRRWKKKSVQCSMLAFHIVVGTKWRINTRRQRRKGAEKSRTIAIRGCIGEERNDSKEREGARRRAIRVLQKEKQQSEGMGGERMGGIYVEGPMRGRIWYGPKIAGNVRARGFPVIQLYRVVPEYLATLRDSSMNTRSYMLIPVRIVQAYIGPLTPLWSLRRARVKRLEVWCIYGRLDKLWYILGSTLCTRLLSTGMVPLRWLADSSSYMFASLTQGIQRVSERER